MNHTCPEPAGLRAGGTPTGVADRQLLSRSRPRSLVPGLGSLARGLVVAAASRGEGPAIELVDDGGKRLIGSGPSPVRIRIHDRRAYGALVRAGSVGLGSSYVAGWWDAEDLTGVVAALLRRSDPLRARLDHWGRRLGPLLDLGGRLVAPTSLADRRNIAAHYDLSNDFFELMLDETMTYSCALFERPGLSLGQAQLAKMERLCTELALGPDDHLIEIGSGWGALAVHAATHYGCRVTTTTISEAQRVFAERRVAAAGLEGRVRVLGQDWRQLRGSFDKLVSVEMVEAVDWRHHDQFLAACSGLLVDGGLAAIQAIVIDDRSFERAKRHQDFVRRMVFPGSCLPSVASLSASLARATDLRIVEVHDIGDHYAETLRRWAQNLAARGEQLDALGVSSEFRRLWSLYLAYCEASFLERHISDIQLVAAKPAWRGRRRWPAD